MEDLTAAQRRFLERVDSVTLTPWTGKIVAVDQAGNTLRLGKATFEKLRSDGYLVRSAGTLTTNTYVVQTAVLNAEIEAKPG